MTTGIIANFSRAQWLHRQALATPPSLAGSCSRDKLRLILYDRMAIVVGINIPKNIPNTQETSHDIAATPEMLTNFSSQVSQSH